MIPGSENVYGELEVGDQTFCQETWESRMESGINGLTTFTLSPMNNPPVVDPQKDKQKKPRHRHSPLQLAALNELYDQNEHPPLDLRSSLAERLGMEIKTVNAWFQNKRASSKRKTRGVSYDITPINSPVGYETASTSINPRHQSEFDDSYDDEYSVTENKLTSRSTSIAPQDPPQPLSTFYPVSPDHTLFLSETDSMPRRMRMRPTPEQTEELRHLYYLNPHPTIDQRQLLAERIGMRYQSITNWFQNQRSIAKKKKDDEADDNFQPMSTSLLSDTRTFSAFPPPSNRHRPSSGPLRPGYSLSPVSRIRRSPSMSPSLDGFSSRRRSSSRHSVTPYANSVTSFSRSRRSRPEPYQLDALKDLFTKTSAPSIEERSALALTIGMDVGKVTNWFRNLRQTARRRGKRSGSGDDDDYDGFDHRIDSASASRSGTPSLRSSASSSSMDLDGDDDYVHEIHSDVGSEDEYEEAVTPPPELVIPEEPPPASSSRISINRLTLSIDPASYAELEKVSALQYSGVRIEDALLLLSFHHHVVH